MYERREFNFHGKQPDELDAIESLEGKEGLKRVQEFIAVVRGEAFASRLEDYMQLRQVQQLTQKYQDEIRSKVLEFSKVFPTVQKVNYHAVKAWTRELEKEGLTSKAIKKRITCLNGYWKYLEELLIAEINQKPPFLGLDIRATKSIERKPWSLEDTENLLKTPTAQTKRDPLLLPFITVSLFTGMRLNEIASLQSSHIKIEENVRFIDINREITKTDAGARKVPLSSKLTPVIDQLLDNLTDDYLFPPSTKPTTKERDLGNKWGKKFQRHKTALGYAKHVECFHSIRHSANVYLSRKGLDVAKREVLIGWKDNRTKSMAETSYGNMDIEYPLPDRRRDIELLSEYYSFI